MELTAQHQATRVRLSTAPAIDVTAVHAAHFSTHVDARRSAPWELPFNVGPASNPAVPLSGSVAPNGLLDANNETDFYARGPHNFSFLFPEPQWISHVVISGTKDRVAGPGTVRNESLLPVSYRISFSPARCENSTSLCFSEPVQFCADCTTRAGARGIYQCASHHAAVHSHTTSHSGHTVVRPLPQCSRIPWHASPERGAHTMAATLAVRFLNRLCHVDVIMPTLV